MGWTRTERIPWAKTLISVVSVGTILMTRAQDAYIIPVETFRTSVGYVSDAPLRIFFFCWNSFPRYYLRTSYWMIFAKSWNASWQDAWATTARSWDCKVRKIKGFCKSNQRIGICQLMHSQKPSGRHPLKLYCSSLGEGRKCYICLFFFKRVCFRDTVYLILINRHYPLTGQFPYLLIKSRDHCLSIWFTANVV